MGFSKLNFIVPLNVGDKILKIRNTNGVVEHIIRESTATIKTSSKYVYLKQSGESNIISLEFMDTTEALAATALLRTALDLLGVNLGINNTGNTGSGWTNEPSHSEDCGCNDCPPKRPSVLINDIWRESNSIPNTAPVISSGVVQIITNLPLTQIVGTKKFTSALFVDVIPPYFGDGTSYGITVKTSTGVVVPSTYYKIDIDCGIVSFKDFVNVGSIVVDAGHPPKVSYYKYIGLKGLASTNYRMSTDEKGEAPTTTSVDGQNTGISALTDMPSGSVSVFVNGVKAEIGNSCTNISFYNPTWDALFAKSYTIVSSTSTSITLSSSADFAVGNNVILVDNVGNITCLQISSIVSNTLNFLISTLNTYTNLYLPRLVGAAKLGDELLWFGSFAEYELGTTDSISYSYLTQ